MPKNNKNDRRERKALLKALGIKIRYEYPPEYHKTECSICFKKIHKGEQLTLERGHVYHGECFKQWALRNTNDGQFDCLQTLPNRQINIFKEGENIFSCPCCRTEYTHDVYSSRIRKVLAKIHLKNEGDNVVHYITDEDETIEFVPMSQISDDRINGKWCSILAMLKNQWEKGHRDIYCHFRLNPEPEYILQTMDVPLPPLDDKKGVPKECVKNGDTLMYRDIYVKDLNNLINDRRR